MTVKQLTTKHDYKIEFIRRSTGVVFTCLQVSGWYLNELCVIGEAEITVPNEWVKDDETGVDKHPRREISAKYADIIQITRDSELVFSGVVRQIKKRFDVLIIHCKSQLWWLTTQHTINESFTEEPATTLKRYLSGYGYHLSDAFNRASIGTDWMFESDGWAINNNQLRATYDTYATTYYCYWANSFSSWTNIRMDFDFLSYKATTTDPAHNLFVKWAYQDSNDYCFIHFDRPNTGMSPEKIHIGWNNGGAISSSGAWLSYDNSHWYDILLTSVTSGGTTTITLLLDGEVFLTHSGSFTPPSTGVFRLESTVNTDGDSTTIDNLKVWYKKQLISEGTIDNFGSSKTTAVSYETYLNAIDERIRKQCASTDSLNSYWEFFENPVAYTNPTTPCASLDFSERIGSNKDIVLSLEERNVIALGAGTAEMDKPGQNVARATDLGAFNDVEFIKEGLYQLSEEIDYDNLVSFAELWLNRRTTFHENIKVDPIDYEARGFHLGDGYKLDIPKLGLSPDNGYYRVMNEKRTFTAEGYETIVVNWKDKTRSFKGILNKLLRQQLNKARYGQGNYVFYQLGFVSDSVNALSYTPYRYFMLNSTLYRGVKSARYFIDSGASNDWQIFIDDIDRTNALFGSATIQGDRYDFDIAPYVSAVGVQHSIRFYNSEPTGPYTFNTWGEIELYRRT
jgi:hypothetical protein